MAREVFDEKGNKLKKPKKKTKVTHLIFECPHCQKHIQATVYGVKLGKKEVL